MTRHHLKLVPSGRKASPPNLPEVLLLQRLNEVRDLWLALPFSWGFPGAWFALFAAVDRLEAQRIRVLKGW
jgi:hypothetical protein